MRRLLTALASLSLGACTGGHPVVTTEVATVSAPPPASCSPPPRGPSSDAPSCDHQSAFWRYVGETGRAAHPLAFVGGARAAMFGLEQGRDQVLEWSSGCDDRPAARVPVPSGAAGWAVDVADSTLWVAPWPREGESRPPLAAVRGGAIVRRIARGPGGRDRVGAGGGTVAWNETDGVHTCTREGTCQTWAVGAVTRLAVSASGRFVVVDGPTLTQIDLRGGTVTVLDAHRDGAGIAVRDDGLVVACGSVDATSPALVGMDCHDVGHLTLDPWDETLVMLDGGVDVTMWRIVTECEARPRLEQVKVAPGNGGEAGAWVTRDEVFLWTQTGLVSSARRSPGGEWVRGEPRAK